jgi:transcriptional regulator with XRE-family HTH domain
MATQDDWSAELTRSIAQQVRRRRKTIGWSAKHLSDACYILGHEIPRSVIADLENGRRRSISIAELLVLARALGASPVELVCPLEFDGQIRVSPTEPLASVEARQWWGGRDTEPDVIKNVMVEVVAPLLERIEAQAVALRAQDNTLALTRSLLDTLAGLAKLPPLPRLPSPPPLSTEGMHGRPDPAAESRGPAGIRGE